MKKFIALSIAVAVLGLAGSAVLAQENPAAEPKASKPAVASEPAAPATVQKAERPVVAYQPPAWEPASVFVPLGLWVVIVLVVAFSLHFRYRKTREVHTTLRAMVEKGAEIPPDLLAPPVRKDSDLRKGIIFLASGLGWLLFALFFFPHVDGGAEVKSLWSLGLIPGMIGLGYLLLWYLRRNKNE